MAASDPTAAAFILRIGDYDVDIRNELGQGAWGTVYKGQHKERKTVVAAKKMRLDPKVPEARDLVRNESEVLLKVKNHPYLLKIHHAEFIDKPYLKFHEFWIITSFCKEGNLNEYCMTHILSLEEKLRICRQTAAGLAFLHNLQPCIIHRDLKPENTFLDIVDGYLTAKLGDFGLARNMEQTFLSTMAGTQSYVAPEMWPWSKGRRLQYDEKIDTFAIGLVHGLVLRQKTKKPLHDLGEAMPLGQQMVNAYETNKPLPVAIMIQKTDDRMTVKWKGLILQMTAYDPSQRPSMEHVEEVYAAMQEALVEKPKSTSSGSAVTPGGSTMVSRAPSSRGLCARALYDYHADEDNEISFDPGDIITNVEEIDEGWWIGVAPDGKRGMFPANYVERLTQGEDSAASKTSASRPQKVIQSSRPNPSTSANSRDSARSDTTPGQQGRNSASTHFSNNDILIPVQFEKLSSRHLITKYSAYLIGVNENYVLEALEKDGRLKKRDLSNEQVVFSVSLPDGVSADCRKFLGPQGEVVLWQEGQKRGFFLFFMPAKPRTTYILDSKGSLRGEYPVEDTPIAVTSRGVVYVHDGVNLVVRSLTDHSQVLTLACGGSYISICEEPTTEKLAVTEWDNRTLLIFSPSGERRVRKQLAYRPNMYQAVMCVSEWLFAVVDYYQYTVRLYDWSSGDELQEVNNQQLGLGNYDVIYQMWMGPDRVFYIMSGGNEICRYQL